MTSRSGLTLSPLARVPVKEVTTDAKTSDSSGVGGRPVTSEKKEEKSWCVLALAPIAPRAFLGAIAVLCALQTEHVRVDGSKASDGIEHRVGVQQPHDDVIIPVWRRQRFPEGVRQACPQSAGARDGGAARDRFSAADPHGTSTRVTERSWPTSSKEYLRRAPTYRILAPATSCGRCKWPSATYSKPSKFVASTEPVPPTDRGRSESLPTPPRTKAWPRNTRAACTRVRADNPT